MDSSVRIDKWLWATRIFKTRSLATDFCKKGKVLIDGIPVKPSRNVQIGDVIQIKKTPVTFTYKVLGLIGKRVSAALAAKHLENLTPDEELYKLKNIHESAFILHDRGVGRPTKKNRRDIEKFKG